MVILFVCLFIMSDKNSSSVFLEIDKIRDKEADERRKPDPKAKEASKAKEANKAKSASNQAAGLSMAAPSQARVRWNRV